MLHSDILGDLNNFAKIIMENENVKNYSLKIDSEKCDDEIIYFNVDSGEKIYNLVMKTKNRSNKIALYDVIYKRELTMYSKIFPELNKFCKDINPKFLLDMIPKIYLTIDEPKKETIILENLLSMGYKLHDMKKPWNLEHSILVMKNYGKFHGISFALSQKRPKFYKELFKILPNVIKKIPCDKDFNRYYKDTFGHVTNYLIEIGRSDLMDKYSRIKENLKTVMYENYNEEHKTVISHGDCWNGNFMFKYKDKEAKIPTKVRFLDFQISCFQTPIKDLSYNIYSTGDKKCLKNLNFLLKTYHKSLINTIGNLGCSNNPFTFESLMNHWKLYGIYGVAVAINLIKVQLLSIENVQKQKEGKNFEVTLTEVEEYKKRILEILIHFGDNFL